MSEQEGFHFAPYVVAGMLDVSVQSVRRWADYHKDYLSATANPEPGTTRGFTWTDVEQLRQIKALRESGLSAAVINTRLSEDIGKAANNLPTAVSVTAIQNPQEGLESTAVPLVASEYLLMIERRFEAVERSKHDAIYLIGIGITIGLAFAGLVIGLAGLYGGG